MVRTVSLPAPGRAVPRRSKRLLSLAGDERLVGHVHAGSEAAFEVVFERYGPGILSFCRHMLGSQEEAEDALQHTFAAAYDDLRRNAGREIRLKPWLFTIARNRCLSMLRARRDDVHVEREPVAAGLAEQVEQRAEFRALVRDIGQLPDEQRAALLLAEVADLPHVEIAEVLDCEVPRVKALVFRARNSLIERRAARETSCEEIREQLAVLSGGSLRRSSIRHHLSLCSGCRAYKAEVKRQRKMLASVLPVVPPVWLKSKILGAAGGGGAAGGLGGAAGGGSIAALTGAGAAGPLGTTLLAKAAVVALIAGGGAVATQASLQRHGKPQGAPPASERGGHGSTATDSPGRTSDGPAARAVGRRARGVSAEKGEGHGNAKGHGRATEARGGASREKTGRGPDELPTSSRQGIDRRPAQADSGPSGRAAPEPPAPEPPLKRGPLEENALPPVDTSPDTVPPVLPPAIGDHADPNAG